MNSENLIIQIVYTEESLDSTRQLLLEYGRSRGFDHALGDYESELAGLPGEFESPQGCLLLATIGQNAAGCVAFRTIGPRVCEMKRLYVSNSFKRQGVGTALVEELLRVAAERDFRKMMLDTHPSMANAAKLYQQFGFLPAERYNQNPTEGILFFEKILE